MSGINHPYTHSKHKEDVCNFYSIPFRKNDKVLQLKNRSDYDLCNGDIGYIKEIDNDNEELVIEFNGNSYVYARKDLNDEQIDLAYAITIHKSQGSEYRKVYLFIDKGCSHFVDIKLLYTAVSRSKVKLCVVSSPSIINNCFIKKGTKRKTSIIDLLNY